ncbi:hypothetical protein AB0J72_44650 [Dactylosporangium sp. NPDC049742]|uniref:hypothetical protein n=1 Tax=Dactylosporangium sp. NPDC049742 TaxID=3154737 RepID=UPI0034316799
MPAIVVEVEHREGEPLLGPPGDAIPAVVPPGPVPLVRGSADEADLIAVTNAGDLRRHVQAGVQQRQAGHRWQAGQIELHQNRAELAILDRPPLGGFVERGRGHSADREQPSQVIAQVGLGRVDAGAGGPERIGDREGDVRSGQPPQPLQVGRERQAETHLVADGRHLPQRRTGMECQVAGGRAGQHNTQRPQRRLAVRGEVQREVRTGPGSDIQTSKPLRFRVWKCE